jgi:hypothetical protein
MNLEEPTMHLKLKIHLYSLLALLTFIILAGCNESTNNPNPNPNPEDKIPPTIISLTPKDKSPSVALSEPVTVSFSEAVKSSTVTNESVTLKSKDGSLLEKTLNLSDDKKTLTIVYKNLTANPSTVAITLASTITDEAGNALAETTWSYATPTWLSLSSALDVDKNNFTFEPSVATDKDGNIVIAWYEQDASSQNRIYVKRWNGNTWEQLGDALNTATDSSADYPSLAIDYQNRPVLAWHETDATFNSTINVKIWTGTTWEQVGGGHGGTTVKVDDGEFPSLAIAPDDTPVVAYAKNGDVFVRLWNGSAWQNWDNAGSLDDNATQIANKPSLVLLSNDAGTTLIPFVAFEEVENSSQPSSNIYVKYYDAAAFAWKDIDEVNDELDIDVTEEARSPSLSLATGSPIVAWEESNGADRDIHVKVLNSGVWEDLGNDDFVGQDSSEPVLLPDNKFSEVSFTIPAVVWRGNDGAGQNVYLKIYNFETGLWETPTTPIEPINTPGIGSEHPVIALDKTGGLVVAFAEFDSVTNSQNLHVKRLNALPLSEMR